MLTRTQHRRFLASFALGLVVAPLAAQKTYKDPRYGFQLRVPKDFREVPINMDEKWVIAKFLYKRALEPRNGWAERVPELRVIVFPKVDIKQVVAARKKREQARAKGKGGKTVTVNLLEYLQNPFKNYKEYLRENFKKGGWFVKDEKKVSVGGMSAVRKLIQVENKMSSSKVLTTLVAWEIDYGDAIYVVQLEVLKDHQRKFISPATRTFTSFKKIPRTEALRPTITTGDKRAESKSSVTKKMSPEERRKVRESDLARAVNKAKSSLPDGWKWYQDGPFTVFYSTSVRFAKRVSKQGKLMWAFMNKHFAYIGQDHSVGGIIRICKDANEASAYADTSSRSGYGLTAREIVLWDDKDWGFNDQGSGRLNQRILNQYLLDKNPRLWWALPPWLDWGMALYIDSLKMKGSRMVAKPDEWDMEIIRDTSRKKAFKPVKDLLVIKNSEFKATQGDRVQCFAVVDYMMGKGKNTKYGKAMHEYLRALDVRLRELEKLRSSAWKKREKESSDEEKQRWASEWKKQSSKIYDDLYKQVFGHWTAKDWTKFDGAWLKAYKR